MEFKQLYAELVATRRWSPRPTQSVVHYAEVLEHYFKGRDVTTINYLDMVDYMAHLRQTSPKGSAMASGTVNRYLSLVHLCFEQYRKHDHRFLPPPLPRESQVEIAIGGLVAVLNAVRRSS